MPRKPTPKKVAKKAAKKRVSSKKGVAQTQSDAEVVRDKTPQRHVRLHDTDVEEGTWGSRAQVTRDVENIQKLMVAKAASRKNRPTDFKTADQLRRQVIPPNHFMWKYLLGSAGWPMGTAILLVGDSHVGKTTLTFTIMGDALRMGGAGLYCYKPGTELGSSRISRILHASPLVAKELASRIITREMHALDELPEIITDWLKIVRGELKQQSMPVRPIPYHTPVVVAADPISAFMTEQEASGLVDWANMKVTTKGQAVPINDIGSGSNMTAAKWFHDFMRRVETLASQYNATFLFPLHQTSSIDFAQSKGPATYLPATYLNLRNSTYRGGKGPAQHASTILIMVDSGKPAVIQQTKQHVGRQIMIRTHKNTCGARGREIKAELRDDHPGDTPYMLEPAFNLDRSLCDLLVEKRYLDTTVRDGLYTCPTLGMYGATEQDVCRALHARGDVIEWLGKALKMEGYFDAVEEAVRAGQAHPAVMEENAQDLPDATDDSDGMGGMTEEQDGQLTD